MGDGQYRINETESGAQPMKVNVPIARFIKRGRTGQRDNAAVMMLTREGADALEEDTVYEIVETLGEMVIRPIGKTQMDPKFWGHELQDVMTNHKPLITQDEAHNQ